MAPNPLIVYPFPTQIAPGQTLDANPVLSDLNAAASAFNNHVHPYGDITGAPAQAASGGDVWMPGEMKMFPGVYVPSVVGCIFPCLGATLWVASVHPACASAVGTWWGGNASLLKLPDMGGRMPVGLATAGNAAVAMAGSNEGVSLAYRRPQHRHTAHNHTQNAHHHDYYTAINSPGGVTGFAYAGVSANTNPGVAPTSDTTATNNAADGGSGNSNDSLDAPAYAVIPYFIRVL